MHTIRQTSGLAGFPKRDESIYDAFGAGHSSTSISAGLGNYSANSAAHLPSAYFGLDELQFLNISQGWQLVETC